MFDFEHVFLNQNLICVLRIFIQPHFIQPNLMLCRTGFLYTSELSIILSTLTRKIAQSDLMERI